MHVMNASEITRQAAAVRDADKMETRLLMAGCFVAGFVACVMLIVWRAV